MVVGTAVFGAPIFLARTLENTAFVHKKMQNRGSPKTAVPTTTHAITLWTPSDSGKLFASQESVSGFPEKGLTSGEVWETSGEVRGTCGEVWETSGEPLDCCKVTQ